MEEDQMLPGACFSTMAHGGNAAKVILNVFHPVTAGRTITMMTRFLLMMLFSKAVGNS